MLKILLITAGVILLFLLIVMVWDSNRFVVKEYHFVSDKVLNTQKYVLLTDLHGKEYGRKNNKLLKAIEEINPTAVLIAGDMLTATPGKPFHHVLDFLAQLAKKYPIYYGNGNHEYRLKIYPSQYGDMAEKYQEGLKKLGISPLCNENVSLFKDNITIYGLEIDRYYYKKGRKKTMDKSYMEKLLGKPDEKRFNILLAHNPAYFSEYAGWGADLVLSGHVHGGIVRLPYLGGVISPSFALFPKYSKGLYREKDSAMVLSAGLGSHTIPIRVFNPAQLVVLNITAK